jgi:hypothetical protein
VRLDYTDRGADTHGVYVGMTSYPPHQRFDQHRAGIRAAGSVLKRGQELLIGPVLHLQRIAQADAERIERDMALALAARESWSRAGIASSAAALAWSTAGRRLFVRHLHETAQRVDEAHLLDRARARFEKRGLATMIARHIARETATFSRLRENRNSRLRGNVLGARRRHRVEHDRRLRPWNLSTVPTGTSASPARPARRAAVAPARCTARRP